MEITQAQYEALDIAYGRKVTATFGEDAKVELELVPIGHLERDDEGNTIGLGVNDSDAVAALFATVPTFGNETERFGVGLATLVDAAGRDELEGRDPFWRVFANDTGFITFQSLKSIDSLIAVMAFLTRTGQRM